MSGGRESTIPALRAYGLEATAVTGGETEGWEGSVGVTTEAVAAEVEA